MAVFVFLSPLIDGADDLACCGLLDYCFSFKEGRREGGRMEGENEGRENK